MARLPNTSASDARQSDESTTDGRQPSSLAEPSFLENPPEIQAMWVLVQLIEGGAQLRERIDGVLAPYGLTWTSLRTLQILIRAGDPIPLSAIARIAKCSRASITQAIDRLEAGKLARRLPDPHDRRSILAKVTDEGRERYFAGRQSYWNAALEMLSFTSPAEREAMHRLLDALVEVNVSVAHLLAPSPTAPVSE